MDTAHAEAGDPAGRKRPSTLSHENGNNDDVHGHA
jgi:hypothetical protein